MNSIHTGVISINSVHPEVIDEIFNNGIDLDYEEYIAENGEDAAEDYESQNPTVLLGFIKNEKGEYDIDPDADICLIYNGDGCTIQIIKSKYVKTDCYMCSPCYPNQGDLDSNTGNMVCYSLKPEDLYEEAPAESKTNIKEID